MYGAKPVGTKTSLFDLYIEGIHCYIISSTQTTLVNILVQVSAYLI